MAVHHNEPISQRCMFHAVVRAWGCSELEAVQRIMRNLGLNVQHAEHDLRVFKNDKYLYLQGLEGEYYALLREETLSQQRKVAAE